MREPLISVASAWLRPLVAALTVALGLLVAAPADAGVDEGDRAPELQNAKTAAGKKIRLKAYKGRWVLVTFGGSWCVPCKDELPAWDKLAGRFKGKVTFVAVNIDNDGGKGKKFMARFKIKNMTVGYMPEEKTPTVDVYDPGTFPSSFVIDPNGVVRHVHRGYHGGDEGKMARTLDELLAR